MQSTFVSLYRLTVSYYFELIKKLNVMTMEIKTLSMNKNTRLTYLLLAAFSLLLIPLIAMQFTDEVNWSAGDFVIMGGLLLSVAFACEFVLRKVKTTQSKILLCGAVLFVFFLIWAELAVGIFGTPFAGS